jgi:hypothetical protein
MSDPTLTPVAVLAIALWREHASPTGLVARITSTTDLTETRSQPEPTYASTRDDLKAEVGRWFDEYQLRQPR